METMVSHPALSVHQEHELLLKLEAAGLDSKLAQLIIGWKHNNLAISVVDFIIRRSQRLSGVEEVHSDYRYPLMYGVNPIKEQIKALAKIFSLSLENTLEFVLEALPTLALPARAEDWFAVPSVNALASRFFPEVKEPAEQYCRAVQLVLQKLGESREFYNQREGQLTPDHLRQCARTAHAMNLIAEQQMNADILVVPAQFGKRHRGRSIDQARDCFAVDEFGLDTVSIGSMLLTHPERLTHPKPLDHDNKLWLNVAGDEFTLLDAKGGLNRALYFYFGDNNVGLDAELIGDTNDHFGSVSAFLPPHRINPEE